jgi:2-oxoglutarate dehydrogenase E2 component (dihydrolipoamide succinyltransferase)
MVIDADFEGVERARRMLRESFLVEEGFSLTYLPFVAKAVVEALRAYPNLNASVEDDSLIIHHRINLGIAVDLDLSGLIVPVIKDADSLGVRGLARAVHDLATRARTRKLSADDISGGTFSISNPGPYGTLVTAPIINQPQVAILSMDGVKRRPVVVSAEDGTEAIAVHSVGMLGVSWDHRAVDGAYIAAFLRRLADIIGTRDWVSEL